MSENGGFIRGSAIEFVYEVDGLVVWKTWVFIRRRIHVMSGEVSAWLL